MKRIINLNIPSLDEIKDLLIDLPFEFELKTKKLAIFDLDETLIHCEIKKPSKGQVQIMVNLPSGEKAKVKLKKITIFFIFKLDRFKYPPLLERMLKRTL